MNNKLEKEKRKMEQRKDTLEESGGKEKGKNGKQVEGEGEWMTRQAISDSRNIGRDY